MGDCGVLLRGLVLLALLGAADVEPLRMQVLQLDARLVVPATTRLQIHRVVQIAVRLRVLYDLPIV